MNTKNILVSFLTIVSVLFLVSTVASTGNTEEDYKINMIEINDIAIDLNAVTPGQAVLIAGETAKIEIWFTATFLKGIDYDTDVTVEVELDTGKEESSDISEEMVMEDGDQRKVTFNLEVPYELDDDRSDEFGAELTVNIEGEDTDFSRNWDLKVQRPAYNIDIKSISMPQTVEAGDTFPVDIVLRNIGYNDLEDIYVTASIPALNIEVSGFFGDIVALECNDEDEDGCDDEDAEDTVNGRLLMEVPYDAEAGVYTLEVEVSNDDFETSVVKQFIVENDFSNTVIVSSFRQTSAVGEDAEYELLIVNPTDKVKVYRIVTENSGDLSTHAGHVLVAVPAGSSSSVAIFASASTEGEYSFDVSIFSGEELVETVTLNLNVEGSSATADLTVILTVILAIIFIVLLVVLIVLIGKKPAKAEEFGESYY